MAMNTKNIIISVGAVLLIGLIFLSQTGSDKNAETPQIVEHPVTATSTQSTAIATSTPVIQPKPEKKVSSGLDILPGTFHYDIVVGKSQCGEKIGTFTIASTIPGEKLYWELQGMKPLWMNLSSTWGETPAHVDMTYNCILSGASDGAYQAALDVMQTNKDGSKSLHKYLFAVVLDGTITLEKK